MKELVVVGCLGPTVESVGCAVVVLSCFCV